jgi:hypothetical protein
VKRLGLAFKLASNFRLEQLGGSIPVIFISMDKTDFSVFCHVILTSSKREFRYVIVFSKRREKQATKYNTTAIDFRVSDWLHVTRIPIKLRGKKPYRHREEIYREETDTSIT